MKTLLFIFSFVPIIGSIILTIESFVGILGSGERLTRPAKLALQRVATFSWMSDGSGFLTFGFGWIPGIIARPLTRIILYVPTVAKIAFKSNPAKAKVVEAQAGAAMNQMAMQSMQSQAMNQNMGAQQEAQIAQKQKEYEMKQTAEEKARYLEQLEQSKDTASQVAHERITNPASKQTNPSPFKSDRPNINNAKPNPKSIPSNRPGIQKKQYTYQRPPFARKSSQNSEKPALTQNPIDKTMKETVAPALALVTKNTVEKEEQKEQGKIQKLLTDTFKAKLENKSEKKAA